MGSLHLQNSHHSEGETRQGGPLESLQTLQTERHFSETLQHVFPYRARPVYKHVGVGHDIESCSTES